MGSFEAGIPERLMEMKIPVHRILGRNPGPMTGPGTNSYMIGSDTLTIVDPGPKDEIQLENFIAAIAGRKLAYIIVTHTHGDHSPGAKKLSELTGAEMVGLSAPEHGSHDREFKPSKLWQHGDIISTDEYSIQLIHTPGHVSNHFCFLLREEQLLFTGDHILQGTTSVILPPDGDMSHYLDSLHSILNLPLKYLAPGHGVIMENPHEEIRQLIKHRLKREDKTLAGLNKLGRCSLDELVLTVYDDVADHLIPWAKKTLTAHLLKLVKDGKVFHEGDFWQLT